MIDKITPSSGVAKHAWILMAIDYFTKWVEAKSYAKLTSKEVCDFVEEHLVTRFGVPRTIITDNGTIFTAERVQINHLKTELYTNKKGADSVEKYMLKLKALKDQLVAAGEVVSEIDLIVVALASLSAEFNMIHTMIVTRETPISLKEYRAQLLVAERNVEESQSTLTFPMSIMYCQGESTNAA
ncbi:uncharacterized protein [Malus domestica]|uniref:uncharacterized protein n=1 Tax=Malus domestica TaxID=3750 RepID=UPI000498B535